MEKINKVDTNFNKTSFTVKKQISEIASQVQGLLEHSFSVDPTNNNLISLKENINSYLINILPDFKDDTFLGDYFSVEEDSLKLDKVKCKIKKNLMIFLPLIIEKIEYKCKKEDISINSKGGKRIILEYINKIFNILFIFGDKIDFYLWDKLLDESSKDIYIKKESLKKTGDNLEYNEEKLVFSILSENNIEKTKLKNGYLKENYLSSIYRVCYKRGQEEYYKYLDEKDNIKDDSKNLNYYISRNIEEEIFIIFKELYTLFIKSIELTDNIDSRLLKLKLVFDKVFGYIDILSTNKVAFNNSKEKKNTFYVDTLTNKAFNENFDNNLSENKIFLLFLNRKEFNNFDEIKDEIDFFKKDKLSVGVNNREKNDIDRNIRETTFQEWENMHPDLSTIIFFSKLLIKEDNGDIALSNELNISYNTNNRLIINYAKIHKVDPEVISNQINNITNSINSGIRLSNFIKQDVNDIQFLYSWWKYILTTKIESKKKKHKSQEILTTRSLGLIEIITNDLVEEGKLDSNKLDLDPNGRLYNMSGMNVGASIDYTLHSSAKGNIDFTNYKIGKILLTDQTELYSLGEKASLGETISFISNGIESSIKILQGNLTFSEENNKYVRLLKNIGIIPQDINKINTTHKDNLTKLIEGLKIIIGRSYKLNDMLKVAKDNYDSVSDLFNPLFDNKEGDNKKIADGLGPNKNFGRAFIKMMKNYKGDYHKLSDLNRLRIKRCSIKKMNESFFEFIKIANDSPLISNVSVDDWTGNPLMLPRKKTGYRDLKALLTLTSGAVVEFQFHYTQMLEIKALGKEIDDETKIKLQSEQSLLNLTELRQFSKIFFELIKKPIDITLLTSISGKEESEIRQKINHKYFSKEGIKAISCDDTYHLVRNLSKNSTLRKKLIRLERIFSDTAWSDIVIKNLEDIGVDI